MTPQCCGLRLLWESYFFACTAGGTPFPDAGRRMTPPAFAGIFISLRIFLLLYHHKIHIESICIPKSALQKSGFLLSASKGTAAGHCSFPGGKRNVCCRIILSSGAASTGRFGTGRAAAPSALQSMFWAGCLPRPTAALPALSGFPVRCCSAARGVLDVCS